MKHIVHHIHFVGIGGAGMSGIAEVLLNLGYRVSGSDIQASSTTQRLAEYGAQIQIGHHAENIGDAEAVVISTAVTGDNPEILAARAASIPVIQRAVMLGELMRLKQGIAIAGTHGKTTTTSLVASVLAEGQLDPTFVIGGKLTSAGANARLGTGDFIVAEADESDASFLNLLPVMEVITNIDADHMETYQHSMPRLKQAFVQFTQRMPFYGVAILCVDDANVRDMLPFVSQSVLKYGLSEDADVMAHDVKAVGATMQFIVTRRTVRRHGPKPSPLEITLNLPGLHNVRNALAAIGVATELGVSDEAIVKALAEFKGVGRRFTKYGEISIPGNKNASFTLIDDYGHHPVEMAATLSAARGAYPNRRLVLAFQPHRYTRTRDCFGEFVKVLHQFDALVLTEVYPAGEPKIKGADSHSLLEALRSSMGKAPVGCLLAEQMVLEKDVKLLAQTILSQVKDGDVVITMGAGSISAVPNQIVQSAQQGGVDE
jgi:UDP-N-acetylmuramate--alanine ligase